MDELEYITTNALMMCDQGGAPDFFKPTYNTKIKIHGCLVATKVDFTPLVNIPSFKICMVTQKPCVPVTIPWENTWAVKVMGQETLIGESKCKCTIGGTIEFMTSGQIPLPDDAQAEVEDMQKQAQRALDDAGYGDSVGEAGFLEGMIPVWGSGRDMINDIQTGDVGGAIMNAGFLVWDVASIAVGVFTFGGGTVAMQAGKAGMKGAIKAGAKTISKKMLQGLGKASFKKLSKEALKESMCKLAAKLTRRVVTACFPVGTPVHTENGILPIEKIKVGDKVWAFNEETNEIALKEVTNTVERESDHTILLYTEVEIIETTAEHPFYVDGQWKIAADLQAGDKITTLKSNEISIKSTKFLYKPQKVFNFVVADWHTYFVGVWAWLVHNNKACMSSAFSALKHAGKYGIDSYKALKKLTKGKGLEVHHLIEKRFAGLFKPPLNKREIPSTVLTKSEHQVFTNDWRKAIPYGTKATQKQVENAAKEIYKNYPEILKALGL